MRGLIRSLNSSLAAALALAGAGLGATAASAADAANPAYGSSAAANKKSLRCDGVFTDGTQRIDIRAPRYLNDVPQPQNFCDFFTFAWNQFAWLIEKSHDPHDAGAETARFMQLAPWYNLLQPPGVKSPTAYPGGDTGLKTAYLNQNKDQAEGSQQKPLALVDVAGATVLYDIRFNRTIYDYVSQNGLWNLSGYSEKCAADKSGNCQTALFLPAPQITPDGVVEGSMEVKTAWRDFGAPKKCPGDHFYCVGRFGLVGMHVGQKTPTHGEFVWSSFEHVANAPDCVPGGEAPIAEQANILYPGPSEMPWSFFLPSSAGPSIMTSQKCSVTDKPPQCNYKPSKTTQPPNQVNVCRTDFLPSGGANEHNCKVAIGSVPQDESNSRGNVACLNATLRPQLSGVWKNYQLIGTTWVRGQTGPTQLFIVEPFQQIMNPLDTIEIGQAVGFPNLANTTMETWAQLGAKGYNPDGLLAGCFGCHNLPNSDTAVFTASTGTFAEDDLSHYPNKFQSGVLGPLLDALTSATSNARP